eukprot:scaffold426_cov219-Amphora_coffeaeformis.AAC.22
MVCKAVMHDPSDPQPEWIRSQDEEEEEDTSDHEEDDDDEEDVSSFWQELRDAWKQHAIALLIAIVAAVVAHRYTHVPPLPVEPSRSRVSYHPASVPHASPAAAPFKLPSFKVEQKHAHLEEYNRMANLTFCNRMQATGEELDVFDFHVPKRLIPTLALHVAADALQDDDYSTVLQPNFDVDAALEEDLMYQCLLTQSSLSQQSFIKGLAYYYPTPTFASMYPDHEAKASISVKQSAPKLSPTQLTFTGFAVKVVNLSPEPVFLFWDGPNQKQKLIGTIQPYEALGTATTKAGQSFSVTPLHDRDHHMDRWVATADDSIHYFQPEGVTNHDHNKMSIQLLNREFERHYLVQTGRQWLAQFPRPLPVHEMWKAAYFGQKHNLPTREKNYKLEVVSVTPRVFSIEGFLSDQECDSLIALGRAAGLAPSSLQAGRSAEETNDRSTRSSSNTWLGRDVANVTDVIYRRAAKLIKMDASLLQKPVGDDYHQHEHSLAESLQLVRYQKDEQYTAHHDFVYPPAFNRHQPTRFATVLFYLNDDFEGGQTVFPRAVNAQYHDGITVQPKKGKAVLFYNMLPDGNMDELSQHASKPVESGEKFLANLWVWDPTIG